MPIRRCQTVFARRLLAGVLALAIVAGGVSPVSATFHTFQLNELYSNASGSVQFIELLEGFGVDGQKSLTGHTLTVTQGPITHSYTFPNDLPSDATARKHVLIATPAFAALGIVTPDYIVPAGFLFINGATIDYAGVDSIAYAALPADGVSSLNRAGTTGVNSPTDFAGQTGTITAPPPPPPAGPSGVPTLWSGAIAALSMLLLVMGITQRARDRRRAVIGRSR
jgi:hypothetical protein